MQGLAYQVLGGHVWIGADGDSAGGPVAVTAWHYLGASESITFEPQHEVHEWTAPSPACRKRTGAVAWQQALNWRASLVQGSNALWKWLLGLDPTVLGGNAAGALTPLEFVNEAKSGTEPFYAWTQFQLYACDDSTTPVCTAQLYSHIMIENGPTLGSGPVQYELTGRVIDSAKQAVALKSYT